MKSKHANASHIPLNSSTMRRTQYLLHFYLFLVKGILLALGLTCEELIEEGSASPFAVEDLSTLANLEVSDLEVCYIYLGKEPLTNAQATTLWAVILQVYGTGSDVPEERLKHLGWIMSGIPPIHFKNLTFSEIDTIAAFGKFPDFNEAQLSSLHDTIREQWQGKEVDDFTSYDLTALGHILCAFNTTYIGMIHPDAYKDAANELATLSNCPHDIFEALAVLASNQDAFGDPSLWTSLQVASVGCIMTGLPSIKLVPAEAMEGLTQEVVACLPPTIFQSMTVEQILKLAPAAANALSSIQKAGLSDAQLYALQQAITGVAASEQNLGKVQYGSGFFFVTYTVMNLILLCYYYTNSVL